MTRYVGAGGASAIAAICMLGMGGSSAAQAQVNTVLAAVESADTGPASAAIPGMTLQVTGPKLSVTLPTTPSAATTVTLKSGPTTATPAWPLWALVESNKQGDPLDSELNCIATAVYFESRGEPLEGQLAVAEVVMNRARSGKYPTSYCGVVKQPAQFSFVRRGQFPRIDPNCPLWAKAQAITRIATRSLVDELPDDVLWYHADYVAPSWGRRLSRVEKIGAHIFYRA